MCFARYNTQRGISVDKIRLQSLVHRLAFICSVLGNRSSVHFAFLSIHLLHEVEWTVIKWRNCWIWKKDTRPQYMYGLWRVREGLLLPQDLYNSTQGFRAFPLIFLECSQYPFTRKVYLSYCTRLLLATRFVLKVKSFQLSWRPTMKISSIPNIYFLTLKCSITLFFFLRTQDLTFFQNS